MWKSVPVLVVLREDIQKYIDSAVEVGGERDYVTVDHLFRAYTQSHPESRRHHPDQVLDAIRDAMRNRGKHVASVLVSSPPPDDEICMGCGESPECGYIDAYQYVKLSSRKPCPYNRECGCMP